MFDTVSPTILLYINCKERKKEVEPFVASPMLNGVPRPFHSLLTMDYI